jgi:predicted RNase H-like HicB family nuclease
MRARNSGKLLKMIKEFNVIIEKDIDGYFVASIPNIKGCHTQAKSLDTLMERIREAAELCLKFESEESVGSEFVGIQKILVEV